MNFSCKEELNAFLSNLVDIGIGSQGTAYLWKQNKTVYKIFHEDDDEEPAFHTENEILRFSDIKNKTFIWPNSVIRVKDEIVGYTIPYVQAKNLYKINPLAVNLDKLEKNITKAHEDIRSLSNNGVVTYDMMYNILYGDSFKIIDDDEYDFSEKDPSIILKDNIRKFNFEIYYFLVDSFFNTVVNDNCLLREYYKDKNTDVLVFLKMFRAYLSELTNKDIAYLKEASKYTDKTNKCLKYQREISSRN